MSEQLDERLGNFSKAIQDQIEELPFLMRSYKDEAKSWLDEQALHAKHEAGDNVTLLRQKAETLKTEIFQRAGKFISLF